MWKTLEKLQKKNTKGITLIALIVTVIVLLIIVGVAVSMITGQDGLFNKANMAREKNNEKVQQEEGQINDLIGKLNSYDTEGLNIIQTPNPTSEIELTDIYVTLYSDGTLAFCSTEEVLPNKNVSKLYGNIKNAQYTSEKNSEDYRVANTPWFNERASIKVINFVDEIIPISTSNWFAQCTNITTINNMNNLNTAKTENMSRMFYNCTGLTSLDVSSFDTRNVTNMNSMFYMCTSLTSLDVSSFDTSNITDMSYMFAAYNANMSLTEIRGLNKFNTSKVTNMRVMFQNCTSLTSLDLSSFNTSKVTNMRFMFNMCTSLTSLDLSSFNTSHVTDMNSMFYMCTSLTSIDLSSFDTSNVTDMSYMFAAYNANMSLTEIRGLNKFSTSKVTNMKAMFQLCTSLTSLDLSSFDTSNVTDMKLMFSTCSKLVKIYVGDNWNTDKVSTSDNMFYDCSSIKGENNTAYNSSYKDKTYARIDAQNTPGYLSSNAINLASNNIQIPYIESTGKQYIDTRYYANQNTKIEMEIESLQWDGVFNPFAGRGGTPNNCVGLWLYYDNTTNYLRYGNNENKIDLNLVNDYRNCKFKINFENGKIKIGEEEINFTLQADFICNYSLHIGVLNNGTGVTNLGQKARIYSCKIYEGNKLIRDYMPVSNTVANCYGLYDKYNNLFYYGSGEDSFIGPTL